MKVIAVVVAAFAITGCSKKADNAPAAKGSDTPAPAPAPTPSAPAAKAGALSAFEMLFSDTPEWTVEAMERGLWISTDGGPLTQACRVQLGMAMARTGKIRTAAKAAPDSVKCEPKGSYTICAFDPPTDKSTPDSRASWVFAADDDSEQTVLIAVLVGTQGDWAKLEPELAKKQACPRPSDDPK